MTRQDPVEQGRSSYGAVGRAQAASVVSVVRLQAEPRGAPGEGEPIRVLLVEDQQIYLAGLRALLEHDPSVAVVGEVTSVELAIAMLERSPDVVVVARQGLLRSPDDEPLRELCARGAAVLVLAESDSDLDLARALQAGARGYLSCRLTASQLLDGIHALARDEPAFDSRVAQQLVSYVTEQQLRRAAPSSPRPIEQLTQRQRAVALLVAEGLSNEEIAARLFVSQATVKSHLGTMMRRLDVRSRTQLAILVNRDHQST
jgi:DNA-binding NarL/FixJ family response regulator